MSIYEKLDSLKVSESHLSFAKKLHEDYNNPNLILDIFPPFMSIEDTIHVFIAFNRKKEDLEAISKTIKGSIGLDNLSFKEKVMSI